MKPTIAGAAGLALLALAALPPAAAAPRTAPRPAPAARDEITVVTLNLWHDQRDWPSRLKRIVRELRALEPDVVCLQEVLEHEKLRNQAATLAESLDCRVHFTSVDPEWARKRYGNAILTRHPLLAVGGRPIAPASDYRTVAHVRVNVRGHEFDVYGTHLHHTREGGAIRAEQVADLLAFVDSTRSGGALVLAGDFNCEPGSPELAPVEARFRNAFEAVHPGVSGAAAATMNPALGAAPVAIDHVFVPHEGKVRLEPVEARILFRDAGPDSVWASDHFGVLARLRVRAAK